jgi:hypothetical protein
LRDTLLSPHSFLGGGNRNKIDFESPSTVLVGGNQNVIGTRATYSVLVGGDSNMVDDEYSFLGGGLLNQVVSGASYSALVGGDSNLVDKELAFLGGGYSNSMSQRLGFIGAGCFNSVEDPSATDASWGTIVGGCTNTVSAEFGFIGNGTIHKVEGFASVVVGGNNNQVFAQQSSILGGTSNKIKLGTVGELSVIGGGNENVIFDGRSAGILAGSSNKIGTTVGTQTPDYSVIAGGESHEIGWQGAHSAVLGGRHLVVQSYNQMAMGRYNKPKGTSVLGTVIPDDPLVIVGNGSSPSNRSNAFEISNSGHAVALHTLTNVGGAKVGGHYNDNMIVAWGDYQAGTGIGPVIHVDRFGVQSVARGAIPGVYVVTLDVHDPDNGPLLLNHGAVTVTVQDAPASPCVIATATRIVNSVFTIRIVNPTDCEPVDAPFFFHVVGRQ